MADAAAKESQLKKLKAVRTPVRTNTTNAVNALNTLLRASPADLKTGDVEDQLAILSLKEASLATLDEQIYDLMDGDDATLPVECDSVERYRQDILVVKAKAKRQLREAGVIIDDTGSTTGSTASSADVMNLINASQSGSRLPTLVISKFSGDYTQFKGFWSQFETMVESKKGLSKVQSFFYLKSYLEGEALDSISGLHPSDANYDEAVRLLKLNYDRDELIAGEHLKRLHKLEVVPNSRDLVALRKFHNECQTNIRSLKALGYDTAMNGAFLCPKLIECLPRDIRLDYAKEKGIAGDLDIDALLEFVRKQLEYREACEFMGKSQTKQNETSRGQERQNHKPPTRDIRSRSRSGYQNNNSSANPSSSSASVFHTNAAIRQRNIFCIFCKTTEHPTYNCRNFTLEEKNNKIKEDNRCYICTRFGHEPRDCTSPYMSCKLCRKKHNLSLCPENSANKAKNSQKQDVAQDTKVQIGNNLVTCGETVLLQTARALGKNPNSGKAEEIRCLLDPGSQASFVNEDISKRLNLPIVGVCPIQITNFGNERPTESVRKLVRISLENASNPSEIIEITAIEVPYVCEAVTMSQFKDIEEMMRKKGLQIADKTNSGDPADPSVGILIGGDCYYDFATGEIARLSKTLVAVETTLGWAVQGPAKIRNIAVGTYAVSVMRVSIDTPTISKTLESFWSLEGMGIYDKEENDPTTGEILEKFKREIKVVDGRYSVRFPWILPKVNLPDNLAVAKRRFQGLIRRFQTDEEFYKSHRAVIKGQLEEGIAEKVANPKIKEEGTYYIPHQAVVRESSATTKLRVVFDASSSVKGSPSLNECISSGPNLNPHLLTLLVKFRRHRVAVTADIEKAFLQVALEQEDRNSVRFLWTVEDENGKIKENEHQVLQMTRIPFGATSSPYLLAATLKFHIEKYKKEYPETFEVLNEQLYVDDLLGGEDDVEGAYKLSENCSKIIGEAKMCLRKWQTNSAKLKKLWGENSEEENSLIKFDGEAEPTERKVLGLSWNPKTDEISVDFSKLLVVIQANQNTKRFLLSTLAQIFDPLGILTPFTIRAKMMFQRLWKWQEDLRKEKKRLLWDDSLPEEISLEFRAWCGEMHKIKEIKIPRCVYQDNQQNIVARELHCFTDASLKAFAAIVYLRYVTDDGKIKIAFVTSKTRVCPTKELSLPRLELMGCLLGARLVSQVKNTFKKENMTIKMWSDSQIAIYWIINPPKENKPFVQNRAAEINKLVDPKYWSHCPGSQNPADLPSRGATAEEIKNNPLWFGGPNWLSQEEEQWPKRKINEMEIAELEDVQREKRKVVLTIRVKDRSGIQKIVDLSRYSKLNKALRVIAYIYRFVNKARREEIEQGEISADEIIKAEIKLIKDIQSEDYSQEIKALKENTDLPKDSSIATLKPRLNDEGVLCLGGRLDEGSFSYERKHPIIINKNQNLARHLMTRSHEEVKHCGIQATASQSRERYWITAGRQLARNIVRHCQLCKRYSAKPCDAPTGLLPRERITEADAFTAVGVDFAGPLFVKIGQNQEKAYVCLFTCNVTRACHLELVPSLTTYEFLMAMRRLIARRGVPSVVYSDNAKTFKRAKQDLNSMWDNIKDNQVRQFFTNKNIRWKFIVEKAPWEGGYYERMVKTTKNILRKTLGKANLTYQEMETALLETEAIINSRPITYLYNDANEPEPLTPSHFLIGKNLTCLPPQKLKIAALPKTQTEFGERVRHREALMQRLWKRWRDEYLSELRTAHHIQLEKRKTNVKIGDVMIIYEDYAPKHMWKLGVVEEVNVGRDGKIRSCLVRLGKGKVIRRPVKHLYALEINRYENKDVNKDVNLNND